MRLRASLIVVASLMITSCVGAPSVSTSPPSTIAAATASPTRAPLAFPAAIAATGKLRVALPTSDQGVLLKDPLSGEPKGAVIDIARELARRANLTFTLVEFTTYPTMVDLMKAGSWDVGIIGREPAREADLDFAPPLIDVDFGYLVRPGSAIKSAADVDQPGVRVIVRRGTPPDAILTPILKNAQLVRIDGSQDVAFEALRAGNGDVLALSRPALSVYLEKLPGSTLLTDKFGVSQFSLVVPKGKVDLLLPVRQFSDELRAGDFVTQAIARSGPKGTLPTVR